MRRTSLSTLSASRTEHNSKVLTTASTLSCSTWSWNQNILETAAIFPNSQNRNIEKILFMPIARPPNWLCRQACSSEGAPPCQGKPCVPTAVVPGKGQYLCRKTQNERCLGFCGQISSCFFCTFTFISRTSLTMRPLYLKWGFRAAFFCKCPREYSFLSTQVTVQPSGK